MALSGKMSVALLLCAVVVAFVQAAPQLFEDQQGVSGERFPGTEPSAYEAYPALIRTRRGSHYGGGYDDQATARTGHGHGHGHGHGWGWQPVGPVFTYVRTDYHGNFQWGVRHRAGGHGWGR